jgi:hypothetical protein
MIPLITIFSLIIIAWIYMEVRNRRRRKRTSREEREVVLADNKKACICATCMSYFGTGEAELLFCASGISKVILQERCVCPTCPVHRKMALRWDYYCTLGRRD